MKKTEPKFDKKKKAVVALFIVIATLTGFLIGVFTGMGIMAHAIHDIAEGVHVEKIDISFNQTQMVNDIFERMHQAGYYKNVSTVKP